MYWLMFKSKIKMNSSLSLLKVKSNRSIIKFYAIDVDEWKFMYIWNIKSIKLMKNQQHEIK
jgi:hypothetical protein